MVMKCAVANCSSRKIDKDISFFAFPLNEELAKKWANFCRRKKPFNYQKGLICMKHFAKEDIRNAVKFEMGFAKRPLLKRGVLPTIFKEEVISPKSKEKAQRRENRRIVREMLKQYDGKNNCAALVTDDSSMESMESVDLTESNAQLVDMNNTIETPTSLEPFLETHRTPLTEFEDVETKLEEQQKEIKELQQENERQQEEIAVVKHQLDVMRLKTAELEKRVTRAEGDNQALEKSLLKFLSKSQLSFLKYGTQRYSWSEADVEIAKFVYTTNRKIYKFLFERGFPMPSIRTMQRWYRTTEPPVVRKKVPTKVPSVPTEVPTVSSEAPTVPSEVYKVLSEAPTVQVEAPKVQMEAPTVQVQTPSAQSEVLTVRVEVPSVHLELLPVHLDVSSAHLKTTTVHLEDHCYTIDTLQ
uniref:Zonadhesin n=1 Tax=Zeugodacus cucurbitae TaxID=28588 RepID=A0A0A1X4A5_ZEUCU